MSDVAKKARAAMKERAQRRAAPEKGDVDASGWREPTMNTTQKTGMQPISKRAFKRGGKVNLKAEGKEGLKHAGRKPRKAGGMTVDDYINRDQKIANEKRGYAHVGGYKKGGKAHSDVAEDKKLIKSMVSKKALKKADGGQTVNRAAKGDYAGKFAPDMSEKDAAAIIANEAAKNAREREFEGLQGRKSGGRTAKARGGSEYGSSTPLRLKKTVTGSNPAKSAKIYKDQDWGEYRVKHYENGKHNEAADYHTDDMEDAHSTASDFVNKKRGGSTGHGKGCTCKACGGMIKKAGGGDVDDMPSDALAGGYNKDAVNKSIASSNRSGRKIGGKEAKLIHALLKGRSERKSGGRTGKADGGSQSAQNTQRPFPTLSAEQQAALATFASNPPRSGRAGRKDGGRTGKKGGGGFGINNPFEGDTGETVDKGLQFLSPAYALARGKAPGTLGLLAGLFKKGGKVGKANYTGGTRPTGGRIAKESGGAMYGGKDGALRAMGDFVNDVTNGTGKVGEAMGAMGAKRAAATDAGASPMTAAPYSQPVVKKAGGRTARKDGGRTKGKTNIHINIETAPKAPAMPMLPPGMLQNKAMPVPPPPMPMGAGAPPVGGAPTGGGIPPGLGVPPPAMGPMARKAGGRVYRSYKDMDAGSGGGKGRLEKAEIQKRKG